MVDIEWYIVAGNYVYNTSVGCAVGIQFNKQLILIITWQAGNNDKLKFCGSLYYSRKAFAEKFLDLSQDKGYELLLNNRNINSCVYRYTISINGKQKSKVRKVPKRYSEKSDTIR